MKHARKNIQTHKQFMLFFGLLVLIMCTALLAKTFSKYVVVEQETHIQESTAFYLESDVLTEEGKHYTVSNWNGIETQNIAFNIKNYTNNLLKTEEDIVYQLTTNVTNNEDNAISVQIKNAQGEEVHTASMQAIQGFQTQKYVLEITSHATLEEGRTFSIEVIATATSAYTKTLKATITLQVGTSPNYTVQLEEAENGEYVALHLQINEPNEDVTVQYNAEKLQLDNSGDIMQNVVLTQGTFHTFTLEKEQLEKGKSYTIYFVKLQNTIVLGTDIKVE